MAIFVTSVLALALLGAPKPSAPAEHPVASQADGAAMVVGCVRARLPRDVREAHRDALVEIVAALRANDAKRAAARWSELVTQLGAKVDTAALVAWILRQAFVEVSADLRDAADRVAYFAEQTRGGGEYIARLKAQAAKLEEAEQVEVALLRRAEYELFAPGLESAGKKLLGRTEIEAEIRRFEEQLNGVGDDAQLANVDLQNVLQKQQQTLQMMSNISKMLYDTATAVIRKIGG